MSSPARRRGGGGAIPAGLRLSTAETRGETELERGGNTWLFSIVQKPSKPLVYIGGEEGEGCALGLPLSSLAEWREVESYSNPIWSRIPPSHLETLFTLCFFLLTPLGP